MGYLLALTSNDSLNRTVLDKFGEVYGENGTFRLIAQDELDNHGHVDGSRVLFSYNYDYLNFNENGQGLSGTP